MSLKSLKKLQAELGITFRDPRLLKQAFTHSSYVNEQRTAGLQDNERLEFLGDAVLQLTVSDYLFRTYPNRPEGELTKHRASIVCEPSLVQFAERLDFGSYVFLGKGEELTGGRSRPALLADVFESFVAALYLDQGLEAVKVFLQANMFPYLAKDAMLQAGDFKTKLQEYTQQRGMGTVEYRIVEERGPAHDREFVSEVWMGDSKLGTGTGRSKKDAEQQAASQALGQLRVALEQ
ncbi:ribonuclease III [Paenibacillus ginsengarvi]|uniref:Ribonuclease 3 n=1 Tax=Paenibacillus ginsengarvi TaxID=400777 RepID=A0A3B0CXM7_9BACL|nr:ribonuclease III [Paenibacillus ginsengarvi]RKN86556.1 ribonuclease III [Paenibacillus ginsengarvi]